MILLRVSVPLGEILAVLGFVMSHFTWLLVIGASASNLSDL